jgi:hypothetical protein
MIALKEEGDEVRDVCMGCHAPTTTVTGDTKAALAVTKEAATCDFCHRISDIEIGKDGVKVTLASGEQKYGPLPSRDGSKDTHPSVQSALFTDSKLCAVCHQWNNAQGVAIFDTYREWLNSPYPKEGVHCQNCHMPLVDGSLLIGKSGVPGEKINSHNLSGGHSIVQVASAATVRIASVERVLGGMRAVVEITNAGSGHMIPTGIPSRELLLDAQLLDSNGTVVETVSHSFKKTVVDENHNELRTDTDIILKGAGISKDNRIAPGETVEIPFFFAASAKKKYLVKATLSYKYNPLVLKEEEILIEMGSDAKSP